MKPFCLFFFNFNMKLVVIQRELRKSKPLEQEMQLLF
jgi:hypothetical protein